MQVFHYNRSRKNRAQKYSGKADWEIISEIASFSKVPIIGNGDITITQWPLSSNKLRAALRHDRTRSNRQSVDLSGHEPSLTERIDCAKETLEAMLEYYGDHGLILAESIWSIIFMVSIMQVA